MERVVLKISATHNEDWRMEIMMFLQGNHPTDGEAWIKRMEAGTRPYKIMDGELFKEGVCWLLLKCPSRCEGQKLMKKTHSGICGSHIGPRSLLGKVFYQ